MCIEQFVGISLIFHLFLKYFNFILGIITNKFPLYWIIVPIVKRIINLALLNVVLFSNPASIFCGLYLVASFFL